MRKDARGEPVSTSSWRALESYEKALAEFHSYTGDPIETISQAVEEDPSFVLGQVFRATLCLLSLEPRLLPQARASLAAAVGYAGRINDRECGLLAAAHCALEGDWQGACKAWETVLVDYPCDSFALQASHLTDLCLGDAENLCGRAARVIPQWHAGCPSYPFVLAMHAFGLEECNHYRRAEEAGRRALELEPYNPWAVQAVAHVMDMEGRFSEGIDWYQQHEWRLANVHGLAKHNWAHKALLFLERGDAGHAVNIYDSHLCPGQTAPGDIVTPVASTRELADATAMLWHFELADLQVTERWSSLADQWVLQAEAGRGTCTRHDIHALMAFIADDRREALASLRDAMKAAIVEGHGDTTQGAVMQRVGLPLADALEAFAAQNWDDAIDGLINLRLEVAKLGGARTERALIDQTLLEAAIRAERDSLAIHLANERVSQRPYSPSAWACMARARRLSGDLPGTHDADLRARLYVYGGRRDTATFDA